jgi:ferredoxin
MGSGNCLYWAPDVFDLDDDGIAIVIGEVAEGDDRVRQAATNCPTGAIRLNGSLGSIG